MISSMYFSPYLNISSMHVSKPSFKGNCFVETLKHTNIGSCLEGYIGKVRVRKGANNQEAFLNVYKRHIGKDMESYALKDDLDRVVGEMNMGINKFEQGSYDTLYYKEDPSHIFVHDLYNYSNPMTPFYKKGLEHYKDVGTRLLQIAQRRSDESRCVGNIKLVAMSESKNWYKNVIGMTEEFPPVPHTNSRIRFNIHNPNSMILPPHNKESLSRLQGGL